MSALPRSYNPFAEDEEEDVAPVGPGGAGGADRQRYLQEQVLRLSAASADSTTRSLSLLYESERIGVAASEVGWGRERSLRPRAAGEELPQGPSALASLTPPGGEACSPCPPDSLLKSLLYSVFSSQTISLCFLGGGVWILREKSQLQPVGLNSTEAGTWPCFQRLSIVLTNF